MVGLARQGQLAAGRAGPAPPSVALVKADPKTLVLQPGDYSSAWTADTTSSGPATGLLHASGRDPLDSYQELIGVSGSAMTNTVAIYRTQGEAQQAFQALMQSPGTALAFGTAFAVGDEQRIFSIDTARSHSTRFFWRDGNVIAALVFIRSTTQYYPTAESLAKFWDGVDAMIFQELSQRVETHIRVARGG